MGIVFHALDEKSNKEVALKILKVLDCEPGYQEIQRLNREILSLSRLSHKNIVQFYEAGEFVYKGTIRPFYTMEYIRGGKSLSQFLKKAKSLHLLIEMMISLAWGLDHAHQNHIVHRDIKPDNILLDKDKVPKILDFGLVRILGETETFRPTQLKMLLGTPYYMAPEQFYSPRNVSYPADIYSLACVFYHLLTGNLPVSSLQTWQHQKAQDMEALSAIFEGLDIHIDFSPYLFLDHILEKIFSKSLSANLLQRYQSAVELAQDLENYQRQKKQSKEHFLSIQHKPFVSIEQRCLFLHPDSCMEKEQSHCYAQLVKFLGEYQLCIKKELSLNGEKKPSGNFLLEDGDIIEIENFCVVYKKIAKKENYFHCISMQ